MEEFIMKRLLLYNSIYIKNLDLLFLLIVTLLLVNSCNNCKPPDCPQLSNTEKSWFPYNEGDMLILKNFKDTISISYEIILTKSKGTVTIHPYDECNSPCLAYYTIDSRYTGIDGYQDRKDFTINKLEGKLYVVIPDRSGFVVTALDKRSEFDLSEAVLQDSISINGVFIKKVYKYTCYPEQEEFAATFVKQGMGLVKIVFRNGQEFELVEHRKAK